MIKFKCVDQNSKKFSINVFLWNIQYLISENNQYVFKFFLISKPQGKEISNSSFSEIILKNLNVPITLTENYHDFSLYEKIIDNINSIENIENSEHIKIEAVILDSTVKNNYITITLRDERKNIFYANLFNLTNCNPLLKGENFSQINFDLLKKTGKSFTFELDVIRKKIADNSMKIFYNIKQIF